MSFINEELNESGRNRALTSLPGSDNIPLREILSSRWSTTRTAKGLPTGRPD